MKRRLARLVLALAMLNASFALAQAARVANRQHPDVRDTGTN